MDDRAWDLLYAANRDVLERAFLDALEQNKDDERSLGDKVIAFLEAARRPDTPDQATSRGLPLPR
jgi:hypothetical protein